MTPSKRKNYSFLECPLFFRGRRGGLTVSALDSGSSDPGSRPGRGHCVVLMGKTLHSHSASLHPGVWMCTGEFNAGGNPAFWVRQYMCVPVVESWQEPRIRTTSQKTAWPVIERENDSYWIYVYLQVSKTNSALRTIVNPVLRPLFFSKNPKKSLTFFFYQKTPLIRSPH